MEIKIYSVDLSKYYTSMHNYLLSTTEYTCGNNILTKQIIYKKLSDKIAMKTSCAFKEKPKLERENYYISKTYANKPHQISHSTFLSKLNENKQSELEIFLEYYEEYLYADNKTIGIIVSGNNGLTKARIEFESISQQEEFAIPEWLLAEIK
jgi:hypothetical protein